MLILNSLTPSLGIKWCGVEGGGGVDWFFVPLKERWGYDGVCLRALERNLTSRIVLRFLFVATTFCETVIFFARLWESNTESPVPSLRREKRPLSKVVVEPLRLGLAFVS
jgi:hypothetical protein